MRIQSVVIQPVQFKGGGMTEAERIYWKQRRLKIKQKLRELKRELKLVEERLEK